MKPIKTTVFIFPAEGKMAYPQAEVPAEVAEQFLTEKESKKRVVITFPSGNKFHRALQRSKNGYFYIGLGKTTLRDAKAEAGTQVNLIIEEDTSEFGMPFPEEFEETLNQDPEAKVKFLALTPGKRRSLLYHIGGGKTLETRIKRALDIAEKLKNDGLYGGGSK